MGTIGEMRFRAKCVLNFTMACALCVAVEAGVASAANTETSSAVKQARSWTLEDIVESPQDIDLSLSEDGRNAMYIVRHGDLRKNAKVSDLYMVDLATGADRKLGSSDWFSSLQTIPGSIDWSVLADLGEGVQLYRIDRGGRFMPVLVNHDLDQVGGSAEGQHAFGISDYGWAPDGKSFWYEKRRSPATGDDRVVNPRSMSHLNWYGSAPVEFRVHSPDGDVLLETIGASLMGYYGVEWDDESLSLTYWMRDNTGRMQQRSWKRGQSGVKNIASEAEAYVPMSGIKGPSGGTLSTSGVGGTRKLVETLKGGSTVDYGHVTFQLGDPRAAGAWASAGGAIALAGTRYLDVPRYGLARIGRSGKVEELAQSGSLTNCSVNRAFTGGICIQQSMVSPPRLIRFDPLKGAVVPVVDIAPAYDAITPLRVAARSWTNRDGYRASGFVVYPRQYEPGHKYPAILVTHASDAAETFADQAFQWDYPVQVWAERGYVVVAMNEPSASQSKDLAAAYAHWGGGASGRLSLERVQDLIWINSVRSFEDAIKELSAEGLVDIDKVGIAGYSRGSQMVNVTMTQSRLFRAASSGDGGYLEPAGYFVVPDSYRQVFGGSPFDPEAVPNYQRLSPTFRAAQSPGAILQQVAIGSASQLGFHVALREAGIPSELVYYPNESHLFHQPRHRLAAMRKNIDWFDFWLLGKEDPDPAKAEQYRRWREMRERWKAGEIVRPAPSMPTSASGHGHVSEARRPTAIGLRRHCASPSLTGCDGHYSARTAPSAMSSVGLLEV